MAEEAGITRVILYRHFDSKTAMYRAVLGRACTRVSETVGSDNFGDTSIPALIRVAAGDPDGFRLLFRHAAKEPEFRDVIDTIRSSSTEATDRYLAQMIPQGPWRNWAALLVPTLTLEAIIAWLDAGQPDPDHAAERIGQAVHGVIRAAQLTDPANP